MIGGQIDPKDNWSSHWTSHAASAELNPAQHYRHYLIVKTIRALVSKPQRLLDIGSGQGDFLALASAFALAPDLVGFELSAVGVEISRRKKIPDACFFQVNLFTQSEEILPYVGSADIAVCSEVIEHVDDPIAFCREIKRYLKPDGILVLTVPGGPMSAFDKHIGHRVHFTRKSILQVVKEAGYCTDKVLLAGFPFFNLYRMIVVLRGKRLVDDVAIDSEPAAGWLARIVMKIFDILFAFNMRNTPFGWQIVIIARPDD